MEEINLYIKITYKNKPLLIKYLPYKHIIQQISASNQVQNSV